MPVGLPCPCGRVSTPGLVADSFAEGAEHQAVTRVVIAAKIHRIQAALNRPRFGSSGGQPGIEGSHHIRVAKFPKLTSVFPTFGLCGVFPKCVVQVRFTRLPFRSNTRVAFNRK